VKLSFHEEFHSLGFQILSKLHSLFLQLNHLPLFSFFNSLINLPKPLQRFCDLSVTKFPISFSFLLLSLLTTTAPFRTVRIIAIGLGGCGRRRSKNREIPPEVRVGDALCRRRGRRRPLLRAGSRTDRNEGPRRGLSRRSAPSIAGCCLRRGRLLRREIVADEELKAAKERPGGGGIAGIGNPSLLDLVLLLERVDAVLALHVGAAGPGAGVAVTCVDGVGDLLPVPLAEVPAVEFEVALSPRLDERERGFLRPAVFPAGERRRPRRWRVCCVRRSSGDGVHDARGGGWGVLVLD